MRFVTRARAGGSGSLDTPRHQFLRLYSRRFSRTVALGVRASGGSLRQAEQRLRGRLPDDERRPPQTAARRPCDLGVASLLPQPGRARPLPPTSRSNRSRGLENETTDPVPGFDGSVEYCGAVLTFFDERSPMRKTVPTFVAGLIASVLGAGALTAQDRVDLAMVARIRAEATRTVQGARDLQLHHQRRRRPADRQPRAQAGRRLRAREARRVGPDECAPRAVSVRPRLGAGEVQPRADRASLLPDVRLSAGVDAVDEGRARPGRRFISPTKPKPRSRRSARNCAARSSSRRRRRPCSRSPIACSPPTPISSSASAARSRRPSGRRPPSCRPTR